MIGSHEVPAGFVPVPRFCGMGAKPAVSPQLSCYRVHAVNNLIAKKKINYFPFSY